MSTDAFEIRVGLWDGCAEKISELLGSLPLSSDAPFSSSVGGAEYFRRKYDPDRVLDWSDDIVVTVWDGEDLAGFGRARKDGFITHVFVARDERGEGLGTRILDILEESLGAEGLRYVFLDADPEAVGFYERNGWIRRESEVTSNSGMLLVPMEKLIE